MAHIFISYSRKDMKTADDLEQRLNEAGFDVWRDRKNIKTGDAWWKKIVEAIKDCSAFAIILSSNSAVSPVVLRELSFALELKKPIFPLGDPWPQTAHV